MKRIFAIAALATLATAAHAQDNNNAAASSTSTATASAPAAGSQVAVTNATGTTTTTAPAAAADTKKWSLSAVVQAELGSSELNYSNRKDKAVDTTNYIGMGYKLDKENSIGFKQYFTASHNPENAEKNKAVNSADMSYPVLTYGHTFKGVAKSDPISALFWYYVPVTATDYKTQNNGILRMDAELVWTLTPQWAVSYYLNPRQSLIPTEGTMDLDGQTVPYFAKTTLIHYGTLYYNVNDNISYYLNVGARHDWKTKSNFALAKEQFLSNLGASFAFNGGKFVLNPEIDYAVTLPRDGSNMKVASTYDEANLSYVMTVVMAY